jgi:hypothetical protein
MASGTPAFLIPLQPTPQQFSITLNGVDYNVRTFWCKPANCWVMNIADANNNPLIFGLPLITGENLLGQFQDIIPGELIVASNIGPPDAVPTFDNLGTVGQVFWINPPTAPSPLPAVPQAEEAISSTVVAFPPGVPSFPTYLWNDGGVLIVLSVAGYPGASTGLPSGALWSDGGVVAVVPGITPYSLAPPLYFGKISASQLLVHGGGDLPLTNPGAGMGQLWNNGGVVCVA